MPADLPIEVWMGVVRYIDPPYSLTFDVGTGDVIKSDRNKGRARRLKNLSLTCKSLRALAQPSLFYNVSLEFQKTIRIRKRIDGLKSILHARPESRQWTKQLVVSNTGTERAIAKGAQYQIPAGELFVLMEGLACISFVGLSLSPWAYEHLHALPDLQYLGLNGCNTTGLVEVGDRKLPLTHFYFDEGSALGFLLHWATSLDALTLGLSDAFIASILRLGKALSLPALKQLTIFGSDDVSLFFVLDLLQVCPLLECLDIDTEDAGAFSEIGNQCCSTNMLVKLSSLASPWNAVEVLLPNRPVQNITTEILAPRITAHLAQILSSGSAPVLRLDLALDICNRETFETMGDALPALIELTIRWQLDLEWTWTLEAFTDLLDALKDLEELVFYSPLESKLKCDVLKDKRVLETVACGERKLRAVRWSEWATWTRLGDTWSP